LTLYPIGGKLLKITQNYHRKGIKMTLADFVRQQRKNYKLTQRDLADRSGVGIRFIRELEGGKPTLRMDKVNMVLDLFGARLGVVQAKGEE
jgi:y4mF family transcriptional regulator